MKNNLPILILLLAVGQVGAQAWSITELPRKMNGLAIATHGNKLFMTGNGTLDNDNASSETVYIYDTETEAFSISQLSAPREAIAALAVGDKVMFAGGAKYVVGVNSFVSTTDTVDIYDVPTGTWSIQKLSAPRRWIAGAVVNGKAYFAGGREPSGPYTSVLDIYDPATDTWSLDTLALPVRSASAAVAGDKLLLFLESSCQILNTVTGEWELVNFPEDRGFGRAVVETPDEVWFIGGSTYLDVIDIYNKADGTWTTKNMIMPRYYAVAFFTQGKVVIVGGDTGTDLTSVVETYNTVTGEWEELSEISSPRCYFSWDGKCPVIGKSAYFPGGLTDFNFTMASQVMDIYTDTTGNTSSLFTPILKAVEISAYPSPFLETLEIQVIFEQAASGSMEVYDLSGCLLFSEKMDGQAIWNKTIATGSWAAGTYLLKLRTAEGVAIRKVVKQ